MCQVSETSKCTKGGESLGDEESSKEEEEVVPALILASGARLLAPDVKSHQSHLHVIQHHASSGNLRDAFYARSLRRMSVIRKLGGPPGMQIAVRPWQDDAQTQRLYRQY